MSAMTGSTGGGIALLHYGFPCTSLLSGGANGELCIYDLDNTTGKPHCTYKLISQVRRNSRYAHKYSIDTVQWYPFDTGIFTTSGMDHYIKIWDTNCMLPVEEINMESKVYSHDMSPVSAKPNLIAVGSSQPSICLIDPKSGSRCHLLTGHKGKVVCVKWSPLAEFLLASGGSDSKIILWDIRSAKRFLHVLDQYNGEQFSNRKDVITSHNGMVTSLQFTSDGLFLLSFGTDSCLRLWDVAFHRNTLVNYGRNLNNYKRKVPLEISYGSLGQLIFVPTFKCIEVYNLFTGMKVYDLRGHFKSVNCCVFRPTMQQLCSGGADSNILFWTPDEEDERESESENSDAWSD